MFEVFFYVQHRVHALEYQLNVGEGSGIDSAGIYTIRNEIMFGLRASSGCISLISVRSVGHRLEISEFSMRTTFEELPEMTMMSV